MQPLARFIRTVYAGGAMMVEMNTEYASSSNLGRLFCFLNYAPAFKYFAQHQHLALDPAFPRNSIRIIRLAVNPPECITSMPVSGTPAWLQGSALPSGPRSHPLYM